MDASGMDASSMNASASQDGTAKAKLISCSSESLKSAGQRLRAGHLVSFPTETVYGLGCHALDPVAIRRVFQAKERPFTDPLIVHVNDAKDALQLWHASCGATALQSQSQPNSHSEPHLDLELDLERAILTTLTEHFWPGPLTIVALAASHPNPVPPLLTAETGYVACRSPQHPVARALIQASGNLPIAAPSANKFGHVSPTRASHVMDDLGAEDVWIVDPHLDRTHSHSDAVENCHVGVESTVVKVQMDRDHTGNTQQHTDGKIGTVALLRHGAVSAHDIAQKLHHTPWGRDTGTLADRLRILTEPKTTGKEVRHVAPGQTIRHYSPNLPSYMVARRTHRRRPDDPRGRAPEVDGRADGAVYTDEEKRCLGSAVVIDFGGRLGSTEALALAYRDLSDEGDSGVAAANVFDALRWSETVERAERVYFPEIDAGDNGSDNDNDNIGGGDALILAIKDRLTRAASGVVIDTLI